jgi:phosphoglycolate phosphatase
MVRTRLAVREVRAAAGQLTRADSTPPDGPRIGVIFDMDGTLIDSREDVLQCVRAAANELEMTLTEDQLRGLSSGAPFATLFPTVVGNTDPAALERFIHAYVTHYDRLRPRQRLAHAYEDTVAMLEGLRAIDPKAELGIATSQTTRGAKLALEGAGLASWFKTAAVIGASGRTEFKPHPASLQLAAARLDLLASDIVVYVGDTPPDILAAHNAGFVAVAVHSPTHGYGTPEELEATRPDYTITDLRELPALVERIYRERTAMASARVHAQPSMAPAVP